MTTNNDKQNDSFSKKYSNRKRNLIIGALMVVIASGAVYYMDLQVNSVQYQTGLIMSHVPLDCMIYYPPELNHTVDNAQAIYYQGVVDGINQTGIKYVGPFLRSPAFQMYMFQNCHVFNGTHPIIFYKTFNKTAIDMNAYSEPSPWLKQQVSIEQQIHDYNFKTNPNNFTRIEQVATDYNISLQSVIDELFLNGVLDINSNGTQTSGADNTHNTCINPSWRSNSDIRQCTWYDSHFVVVKHNQDLLAILDKPIDGLNHHE